MPPQTEERWVEVSPSQFSHETEGLSLVRQLLPQQPPFRAWSNFEFRDSYGRWYEVDLLVLGRRQLHLIELKYYSGVLRGDDHIWRRGGNRAEESPLKLANRKAKIFKGKLFDEYKRWVQERKIHTAPPPHQAIPHVHASVLLHHPQFRSELAQASAIDLYGLDSATNTSNLPGISQLLLEPADPRNSIREQMLAELMKRIGLVQRRQREAGSYVIEDALAEGDGWQEWSAFHRVMQTQRARIRFQVTAPDTSAGERSRIRQIAEHEFRVMKRLRHDNILSPDDLVDADLGVGLVYPFEEGWQRLDLWLADRVNGVPIETQLSIIRQIGEALQHAHANRLVHRGLSPRAIWLRDQGEAVKVQVRDWQSAGRVAAENGGTRSALAGVTSLFDLSQQDRTDTDQWLVEAFAAPEGALAGGVDRVRVDVFGLGALAFFLLSGRPAVRSSAELRSRLREQSGLDLAPELPQVTSALRSAVLNATRPAVSERTSDVATFLAQLSQEEQRDTDHEPFVDPLEATVPDTVLDGRFRLKRRLGRGSTAVGLLVTDLAAEGGPDRVLKVALDQSANQRLADEAEVLTNLKSARLVAMVEGPIVVGGRTALLLESAGEETLAEARGGRARMSLDWLERWGTDLLEALIALDQAGIDHRDIKPANLGVRESPSDRTRHLVLFDFSLAKAPASAILAGTPPYLDPFLGTGGRDRYDSAAERYAAAVVLFEMATGEPPRYGDGMSDAATIPDEATVEAERFDPALAEALVPFFRRALARDAEKRFETAAQMVAAWRAIFDQTTTGQPENASQLIEQADLDTPLARAGLSARALSALEPQALNTVGDLAALDAGRLSVLKGVGETTRKEIRSVAKIWREKFAADLKNRRRSSGMRNVHLPNPRDVADRLMESARAGRGRSRASLVSQVLGVTGAAEAFASRAQLGARLPEPVTAARVTQIAQELQEVWAGHETSRDLLTALSAEVEARLAELGGVATVDELADHLITRMVADPLSDDNEDQRIAAGLVRLVVERRQALVRGQDEVSEYAVRRRERRPVLLAVDPDLLDVADSLAATADRLVAQVNSSGTVDQIVPPDRVAVALAADVSVVVDTHTELGNPGRAARLAAALSDRAAASSVHELHDRALPSERATAVTLRGVAPGQVLRPQEIRDRVRARFPAVAPLPDMPRLAQIVAESGLPLTYSERERLFRSPDPAHDTTGLHSRPATAYAVIAEPLSTGGVVGQRLADSLARRSFLSLGVAARYLDRLVAVLETDYRASVVDLTAELLSAMQREAAAVNMPWDRIVEADAEPVGSRANRAVDVLVQRSLPALQQSIEQALRAEPADPSTDRPVVLTDAGPLARYGALSLLSRWTDLAAPRPRALWLIAPQLNANRGPMVDLRPLPLSAPSQYVHVDDDWVAARTEAGRPTTKEQVG